jgi:hypothetical protein
MKCLVLFLALLASFVASTNSALCARYYINETTAGCLTQDDLDHLSSISQDGDRVAFTKIVSSGFCRILSKGTRVFTEQVPDDYPIECVRPEGGVACFWVMKRSVSAQ